jgi:hypothetical protein
MDRPGRPTGGHRRPETGEVNGDGVAVWGERPRAGARASMMVEVGALVTLELPDDSPVLSLPWIITFGPLSDEDEWEPVVCGPYERPHALALAESVVADEELMAVVEPLLPAASVDEIRGEIVAAKMAAEEEAAAADEVELYGNYEDIAEGVLEEVAEEDHHIEPGPPPSPEEVRAGFARIAAKLTGGGR